MPDQTQVYPELTPRDLQDPTLHRLNQIINFLYSQIAQTQGITGSFQFTNPQAKSTAIPSSNNCLITLGAALELIGDANPSDSAAVLALSKYFKVTLKTVTSSIVKSDEYIGATSSGASVVLTLPTIVTTYDTISHSGKEFIVKWAATSGSNTLTLDGAGAELIEGAATYVFGTVGDAIIIQNDGTQWRIVARYSTTENIWRWVTVGTSVRADYQVGIGKDPLEQLDVAGVVQGTFKDNTFTATRAALIDGSKVIISGTIDLGSSSYRTGTLNVGNGGTGVAAANIAAILSNWSVYTIAQVDALINTQNVAITDLQNNKADHGTYPVVAGNVTI